jgi:hypothetical protein
MKNTTNDDLYWDCDKCPNRFTIGNGFIGSVNDLKYYLNKDIPKDEIQECNPFMSFIQLCSACCEIEKYRKNGK